MANSSNETAIPGYGVGEGLLNPDVALKILQENGDQFFLTVMGTIVIFMQAGFGFLEAGSIRSKNTTSVLIKNLAELIFGGIFFWLIGYGLAFGDNGWSSFIGSSYFAAVGLPPEKYAHLFFQSTFAATCSSIVSGAVSERCHFQGHVVFSTLITAVVYPIHVHWCWCKDGWLATRGFYDFAGSGVVHLSGGVHALVGTYILGPRIGRFGNPGSTYISGHSMPLTALGGFILLFGFLAFNCGSQGSLSKMGDGAAVGSAAVSTLLACAGGGLSALLFWKVMPGSDKAWSLTRTLNGCLAGMVSVCGGCDNYPTWVAAGLGAIAAILYLMASRLLIWLQLDDPLDAAPIHAVSGLLGLMAAPLLTKGGVAFNRSEESLDQFKWNVIGALALVAWNLVAALINFTVLDYFQLFRVPPEVELGGLDLVKHNEPAYGFDPTVLVKEALSTDLLGTGRLGKDPHLRQKGIVANNSLANQTGLNGGGFLFTRDHQNVAKRDLDKRDIPIFMVSPVAPVTH